MIREVALNFASNSSFSEANLAPLSIPTEMEVGRLGVGANDNHLASDVTMSMKLWRQPYIGRQLAPNSNGSL